MLTMFSGRGAGSPTASGSTPGLDVPRVVVAAGHPGPPDPDRARAGQPSDLRGVAGAEDEVVEPVGAGDERVLVVVGSVDHAVAGPDLVHVAVLPGEPRPFEDVEDLLGCAVRMRWGRELSRGDAHTVEADGPCARRAAEPLPGRVHLALGAVLPFDLVPVGDSHAREITASRRPR